MNFNHYQEKERRKKLSMHFIKNYLYIHVAIISDTCERSIVSCIEARLMLYFYKYIYVLTFCTDKKRVSYISRAIYTYIYIYIYDNGTIFDKER